MLIFQSLFDINKLMEVLTSLLDLEYTEDENVQ